MSKDLEQEHREIDRGIEAFASGLAEGDHRTTVLSDALAELRRHIYFEEEMLFPPLHDAGLVPPLFVMRREHGELWASMDALSEGLASGMEPAALREVVARLMAQLEMHNAKEETIVYPATDSLLPAPTQDELSSQLGSVQMPDHWVCEAARR